MISNRRLNLEVHTLMKNSRYYFRVWQDQTHQRIEEIEVGIG